MYFIMNQSRNSFAPPACAERDPVHAPPACAERYPVPVAPPGDTTEKKGTGPLLQDRTIPFLAVWQEGVPTHSTHAEPT